MYKYKDAQKSPVGWRFLSPTPFFLLLPLAFLFFIALNIVLAQMPVQGSVVLAQADAPAALPPPREVTADEVNTVAREIWCPLCSGVRLDACELKACDQMKEVIAIKLAEGEDTASIKAYFVEQYGPQVLGEPPRTGFNWLAWILPVVAVVAGGFFFWRTTQRMMQPNSAAAAALALDNSPPAQPVAPLTLNRGSAGTTPVQAQPIDEDEAYKQKLEEELAKYG